MKKLIVLAVVVAAVAAGLPYVTGQVAESVTRDMAEQVNLNAVEYGEVQINEYARGFRRSEFQLEWSAPALYQPLFKEPLIYDCKGTHGIISYAYTCQAKNLPTYAEFVKAELGGVDPLSIGGEVSIFGEFTKIVELKPFTASLTEGESVQVGEARLEVRTGRDLKAFDLNGTFEGTTFTAGADQMQIEPMEMTGEVSINEHRVVLGDVSLAGGGMSAESAADGSFQMGAYELISRSSANNGLLTAGYEMTIAEFSQQPASQTGLDSMQDVSMNVEFSGVDMAELADVTSRLRELAKFDGKQSLSSEEESSRNAQTLAMLPEVEDLLKQGLGLSMQFGALLEDQELIAQLNTQLIKDLSLGDFILLSVQPQAFFGKFDLDLNLGIPANLVESSAESANAVANSRLFERDQDHYKIVLRVLDGNISLNGKRLSVEEFMGYLQLGAAR